jgi:hypothetical protein
LPHLEEANGRGREVGGKEACTRVGLHEGQDCVAHSTSVLKECALPYIRHSIHSIGGEADTRHACQNERDEGVKKPAPTTHLVLAGEELRELVVQVVPVLKSSHHNQNRQRIASPRSTQSNNSGHNAQAHNATQHTLKKLTVLFW